MELTFKDAHWTDAEALIELYNAAFYDDYVKYGQCPGYGRSKDEMEVSILRFPKTMACLDDKIVGVVSGQMVDIGVFEIGALCVHPEYQRKGIGKRLFEQFLTLCPNWKQIMLITPAGNSDAIRFYTEKCGMRVCGEELIDTVTVVRLRKEQ